MMFAVRCREDVLKTVTCSSRSKIGSSLSSVIATFLATQSAQPPVPFGSALEWNM